MVNVRQHSLSRRESLQQRPEATVSHEHGIENKGLTSMEHRVWKVLRRSKSRHSCL